ncbi:MAG: hypothetical protein C3F06_02390 [Candidatus Methanoperedenaceae archaeon]|nr:MAG: hypothetical protein C3F06_02390 [Candidatus Methanoperedenaceae archaeon]
MNFELLSDDNFKYFSEAKALLAHIVNECCKESIDGRWLVIEETAAYILIEVRYLEKLERDYLSNSVFSYVDSMPGAAQKVRRHGKNNEILWIEVKWALPPEIAPGAPLGDRIEPDHHLDRR